MIYIKEKSEHGLSNNGSPKSETMLLTFGTGYIKFEKVRNVVRYTQMPYLFTEYGYRK